MRLQLQIILQRFQVLNIVGQICGTHIGVDRILLLIHSVPGENRGQLLAQLVGNRLSRVLFHPTDGIRYRTPGLFQGISIVVFQVNPHRLQRLVVGGAVSILLQGEHRIIIHDLPVILPGVRFIPTTGQQRSCQ